MVTKNKMEKKKIGQKILLVLCTMVFAVSTSKLISLWIQYKQASDDFNKLRNEIMTDPNTDKNKNREKSQNYLIIKTGRTKPGFNRVDLSS